MQDRELVAAIVAGDPAGLAEAYDRYGAPLYAYCRLMLPDPVPLDSADGAVQDTFVVATSRLQGLRDPNGLRAWLHAVARNECLRRLGPAGGAAGLAGCAGRPDQDGPVSPVTPPAELREQVLAACADATPTGRAYRVGVAHRAEPFNRSGFPKPTVPRGPRWWQEIRKHPRSRPAWRRPRLACGERDVSADRGRRPGGRLHDQRTGWRGRQGDGGTGQGSLKADGSVTVTVTVTVKSLVALRTKVTVNPGALAVTVVFSIKA